MEPAIKHPDVSLQQRQLILATLRTVLDSRHFCKSKRYPSFLEFVVLNTLEENSNALKERAVGVEVFGRRPNYDTSADPVVRVAAGEVRRRAAAYFSEHPDAPVRIKIPAGSYHAEFCFHPLPEDGSSIQKEHTPKTFDTAPDNPGIKPRDNWLFYACFPFTVGKTKRAPHRWDLRSRLLLLVAAMLMLVVAGAGLWNHLHDRVRREFWWPVLHGTEPALIIMGRTNGPAPAEVGRPAAAVDAAGGFNSLILDDAIAAAQICTVFHEYGRVCKVAAAQEVRVEDMRGKSLVVVGGLEKPLTQRLLSSLPNRPQSPSNNTLSISEHRLSGDTPLWKIGPDGSSEDNDKDYAIVARFRSDITDGMIVAVAGLRPTGTVSAGQYVSSPEKLDEILSRAPKNWKGINFEAVLQVDVVGGNAGHTQVVATNFW